MVELFAARTKDGMTNIDHRKGNPAIVAFFPSEGTEPQIMPAIFRELRRSGLVGTPSSELMLFDRRRVVIPSCAIKKGQIDLPEIGTLHIIRLPLKNADGSVNIEAASIREGFNEQFLYEQFGSFPNFPRGFAQSVV